MPITNRLRAALFMTSALSAAGLASAAFAQAAAPTPAPAPANSNAIEEVVVTATRQNSTVNKVALSVSAVTQKSLDQQGIRNVADLSNQVPGFTFRVSGGDNNPQLSIRGIGGNAIAGTSGGAPTTGVYLDDTPMMKRNGNGLLTGSGSPLPLLYDLDRVEVLRGPQGTLFGGSAEGGAIRFITPTPSLTTYSGSARIGVSTIAGGGTGNEEGFALGGPVVQDKLGFRLSLFRQDRPGWINSYSEYDGHQFHSQNNWGTDYSIHFSSLWQVTPNFKAQVSVQHQMNYDNDGPGIRTSSPAITVPTTRFNNCNYVPGTPSALVPTGCSAVAALSPTGVSYSFPQTVLPGYTVPATPFLSNSSRNGVVNGLYLTPTNVQYVNSPRRTIFTQPTVTLDYNLNDKFDFKSVTSYTDDRSSGDQFTGGYGTRTTDFPNLAGQPCPSGSGMVVPINLTGTQTLQNGCTIAVPYLPANLTNPMALAQGGSAAAAGINVTGQSSTTVPGYNTGTQYPNAGPANVFGYYFYNNRRGQVTQEFRVSTTDPSSRLQFVAGAFIEHEHNHINVGSSWNEDYWATQLRGVDEAYTTGGVLNAPVQQTPGNGAYDVSTRNIDITENEQSIFADATFAVTSKFKITAGFRATNYSQQFYQIYGGAVAGAPTGLAADNVTPVAYQGASSTGQSYTYTDAKGVSHTVPLETNPKSSTSFPTNYGACPASPQLASGTLNAGKYAQAGCPYQYSTISLNEHPVVPKVGGSYEIQPGDLLYVTYSEAERPGGTNPPVPATFCASDLANLGIATSPTVYHNDTVKSTEVGGKFRLFNGQAQINASAFHMDWVGVQFNVPLPLCAFSYTANAGNAASDGAEVQATARFMGFTFNGNLGYDNARYTQAVLGPKPAGGGTAKILANKGDNLGIPDWTGNAGLQYDTRVVEFPVYARIDYAYTGRYLRSTTAGSATYNAAVNPNFIQGNETHVINLRAGIYIKSLEIAGYVKNAGDSREWINKTQTNGNYYYTGNTVVPRIVGMQMNYRF